MNYFILINDVQQGPFTIDELRRQGIKQDTLVWCEGMEQWTPAWKVEELKGIVLEAPKQAPPGPPRGDADYIKSNPTPPPAPPLQGGEQQNPGNGSETYNGYSGYSNYGNYKKKPKKGHKGLWAFLVLLLIILFVLALTNPGVAEHRKAILDRMDTATEQVDNIGDPMVRGIVSGIMGMGNGMVKEVVRQLIDENLEYHNYIFFSTTTLKSDLLRKEIRTSTGFLGKVNAVSLSNIMPDIIMQQLGGDKAFDNGTTESTVTTVDSDGNETTETTKTTKKNGITVDSLTKRVTNRIADEVARKVKNEVRQQADSTTASGIESIVNDVVNFIKGL